jgi:hypothetical protein
MLDPNITKPSKTKKLNFTDNATKRTGFRTGTETTNSSSSKSSKEQEK